MARWGIGLLLVACWWGTVGCTVGPDFRAPRSPTLHDWFLQSAEYVGTDPEAELASWWQQLNDPTLDLLIHQALADNVDLQTACCRIAEARARRGVIRSQFFPQLTGTSSYSQKRTSPNANQFVGRPDLLDGFEIYSAGIDAAWQLDLVGKIRRAVEASDAEIEIQREAYRDVVVTLLGDVASTYTQIRVLQAQLQIAQQNLTTQQASLALVKERQRLGLVSELDVAQATSITHTTTAAIPALQEQLQVALHRLAVLLGEIPNAELEALVGSGDLVTPPDILFVGVPAEMLRRRPDIKQAEFAVAAENARIGVAVAELYPQFSLPGTISVDSRDFTNWFTGESLAYSFGPAVRWNLFSFGRVRNSIEAQRAKHCQAVAAYQSAVLHAVQEVEDGLVQYHREQERVASLVQAVDANRDAVRLSRDVYQQGLIPFQSVLDAQRQLLATEVELALSRGNVVLGAIRTYTAAGGGWNAACVEPLSPVALSTNR